MRRISGCFPFYIIFSSFDVVSHSADSPSRRAVMRGGGGWGGKLSFLLGIVTSRPQRSQIPTAASRSERSG